jgi:hypothetical protein
MGHPGGRYPRPDGRGVRLEAVAVGRPPNRVLGLVRALSSAGTDLWDQRRLPEHGYLAGEVEARRFGRAGDRAASLGVDLDYYAASIRYYYNGRCTWCGDGYEGGRAWKSMGAWFEPNPWNNAGQLNYIAKLSAALANRTWENY